MTTPSIFPDTDNLKRCTKCGEHKPRELFARKKDSRDGLHPYCKVCVRAANKAYYAAHKELEKSRSKAWHAANRERKSSLNKAWKHANRQHASELIRAWQKRNPERAIAYAHRHRALKWAGGVYTDTDTAAIRAAQTDKKGRLICWRCGKPITGTPHLDHWIPLAKHGGENRAGNLHYMHAKCNQSKSTKHPFELGRLL
jgi:hypothetical protein